MHEQERPNLARHERGRHPLHVRRLRAGVRADKQLVHPPKLENPKGYAEKDAFTLGSLSAEFETLSLLSDTIRVHDVTIDAPFFRPDLPWEMHCIEAPTVVEHNGIWYMFYAGAYNHERQQIGVAWSADGVHFTRYRDEPVFPHGAKGSWNEWESGHPGLFVDDDGQVYLFFQGKSTLKGDYSLSCAKVKFVD